MKFYLLKKVSGGRGQACCASQSPWPPFQNLLALLDLLDVTCRDCWHLLSPLAGQSGPHHCDHRRHQLCTPHSSVTLSELHQYIVWREGGRILLAAYRIKMQTIIKSENINDHKMSIGSVLYSNSLKSNSLKAFDHLTMFFKHLCHKDTSSKYVLHLKCTNSVTIKLLIYH